MYWVLTMYITTVKTHARKKYQTFESQLQGNLKIVSYY